MTCCRQRPLAAGYPFDIPNTGSNLLTYCVLSYHLPLLIAFSMRQRTQFVWGGFMLFPLAAMLDDRHGIMKVGSQHLSNTLPSCSRLLGIFWHASETLPMVRLST